MTTQYTSILKLALPVQGELSGTWGDVVNDNITSMVEEAVAGRAVINTWTTNSHTLTTADGTTSEARCAMLEFTDTGAALTGAATVVCPSASKLYVCKNDSGQQVTIQTAAGTGVAIPDGQTMFVFCDGTNVEQCETNFNSLSYNGYTLNFGGAVTTAGAFTTSGAYALTLTTTGATDVTLPTTGTLATLDGTETLTNKTLTAPTISSPSLTGSISATDLTISGNTTIGDASADTLTVNSTITSNLIFTDDTYDIGATGATRPRNLFLSGNATIGGTVTLSGGIDVTGALGVDGDFDVNTDKFTVASATGNTLVAGTLGVTGITTATGGLNVDTISEITAAGGVTIDSVLLKDGGATLTGDLTVDTDTLYVDSANDLVGIGESSPAYTLDIKGNSSTTHGIRLKNSDTAVGGGQVLSQIIFENNDDSGGIEGNYYIKNVSADGFAATNLDIQYDRLGGAVSRLKFIDASGYLASVFNEAGEDVDFRVESSTNTNALFVDAGNSRIGFFNSAPAAPLHLIAGTSGGSLSDAFQISDSTYVNIAMYSGGADGEIRVGASGILRGVYKAQYAGTRSANDFSIGANLINAITFDSGGPIKVNDGGLSTVDFRVESDNNANMLFVDAGADTVQIAHSSALSIAPLNVQADASGARAIRIIGRSDDYGEFDFYENDNTTILSRIQAHTTAFNIRAYDPPMVLQVSGSTDAMRLTSTDVVVNEGGLDRDFRVESDGVANMLLVDAGNNSVAINRSYGIAPLHVSGSANDTVAPENSYAKITAQGLDGIAIGSIASSPFTGWIQSGYTDNTYSPDWNNGYPLALNPVNANVVIGGTNVTDSTDGLAIQSSSRDNLSIQYTGTSGGHVSGIRFFDFRGQLNARVNNNLINDGVGVAEAHLEFGTAYNGTFYERLSLSKNEAVFNDQSADTDFRVESSSQPFAFYVDAGTSATTFTNSGGYQARFESNGDGQRLVSNNVGHTMGMCSGTSFALGSNNTFIKLTGGGGVVRITANSNGVNLNNNATSFSSASDIRLKNITGTFTNAIEDVKTLEPVKFTWKHDAENTPNVGFTAQSVQPVLPEAVDSNDVFDDGTEYLSVRYTEVIPLLTAALQDAIAKIETLEAKVTALENA